MKAIGLTRYLPVTDPDCLRDFTIEQGTPREHDLLVAVTAVSVNPVDTKIRAPKEQEEAEPRILGWDACGVVLSVGSAVTLFQAGDRVFMPVMLRAPAVIVSTIW